MKPIYNWEYIPLTNKQYPQRSWYSESASDEKNVINQTQMIKYGA